MTKNIYKKGTEFIHKESRKKVNFLKWLDKNTANCLSKEDGFLQLSREVLDNEYISVSSTQRESKAQREKRMGQMW